MKYRIRYAETAKQDLTDITFAIYERSKDVDTALNFSTKLKASVRHLDEFYMSGEPIRDRNLIEYNYRYVLCGDYLSIYSVNDELKTVWIEAVLNGKSDYIKKLINRAHNQT